MTLHIHAPSGVYYARVRKPRQKMWTLINEDGVDSRDTAISLACKAISDNEDYKFFDVIFVSSCGYYGPVAVWECRVK